MKFLSVLLIIAAGLCFVYGAWLLTQSILIFWWQTQPFSLILWGAVWPLLLCAGILRE